MWRMHALATRHALAGTCALALAPLVGFLVGIAHTYWEISRSIPIITLYLWSLTFYSLIKSAIPCRGIPRDIHIIDIKDSKEIPLVYNTCNFSKYCHTCNVWRPHRAAHCSKCNCCFPQCDHHCPWLNNCIHYQNYRYFITFLLMGNSTMLLLMVLSFLKIHLDGIHSSKWALANGILISLTWPYMALLLGFHIWLGEKGITTREFFAKSPKRSWCLTDADHGLQNISMQWFHGN
ncbi:uncharacterized protein C5L36_0E04270 [Pichia kudriavzevii]|uniref:Palmitoyltransferase n=1 Tax=Pichia kudriavzevii TaxID=4909 RepID=A0A2U9RAB1_PICKU|nr:uncharacterized protein C5L36_0E04270 [Pichia kudriavzevii]AWU78372.1 hypothetical protein C5L36_0E04270 [Pichia kudriavzevii]